MPRKEHLSAEAGQILLNKIIHTSTQSRAHINLVREYDFSDSKDYTTFDLDTLMELIFLGNRQGNFSTAKLWRFLYFLLIYPIF